MHLFDYVGKRIREFRENYAGGEGISQDGLAKALGVAANTISRWETATHRPDLEDLDRLSRFFGVSILEFFPREEAPADERLSALLRTAKQLEPEDLEELRRYAEFRRARNFVAQGTRTRPGRKRKEPGE